MFKKSLVLLSLCAVMSLEAGKGPKHEGKMEEGRENNNSLKQRMINVGYKNFHKNDAQLSAFNFGCEKAGLKDCSDIATFWDKFKQLNDADKKEVRTRLNKAFPKPE